MLKQKKKAFILIFLGFDIFLFEKIYLFLHEICELKLNINYKKLLNKMKKKMEKPFIQVMKLNAMDVIATSKETQENGLSIQQLSTPNDNKSIGF